MSKMVNRLWAAIVVAIIASSMPGWAEEKRPPKSETAAPAPKTKPPSTAAPKPETKPPAAEASKPATEPAPDRPPAADAPGKEAPRSAAEEEERTGAYTVRLRDLEDRINRLKEQIFRTKARLNLLAESVLDRKIAGAKAQITFRNEMTGAFRLEKATFLLDGGPVFNKTDEGGSLADREEIRIFDGPVMPGEHTLSVVLIYRGHGYGVFSYLRGYTFKTRSSHSFSVGAGKLLTMAVVGYEKGNAMTPIEERPDVRYSQQVEDLDDEASGDEAGAAQKNGKEEE